MAVEHRVTIRLSPVLYGHLVTRSLDGQPVAAIVRQALALYLGEDTSTRQPWQPPLADTAAGLAAELAAIQSRLAAVEQRLEGLEASRALVEKRQPARQSDRPTGSVTPAFDPTRYRLGKLCPRGHDWQGSGQSLRVRNKAGYCLACQAEDARASRAAKRQGG